MNSVEKILNFKNSIDHTILIWIQLKILKFV